MKYFGNPFLAHHPFGKRFPAGWLGLCLVAAWAAGCSHSDPLETREATRARLSTPRPPPFLNGPLALLLTNVGGFNAHVEGRLESFFARDGVLAGEVLGNGTKLVFAPSSDEPSDKRTPAGGFSFIWDVADGSGFVLSEALQGYAAVSIKADLTNVLTLAQPGWAQKLGGHACESEDTTFQMANGTALDVRVLRATDLNRFPVRIVSRTNPPPISLTFSKIRLELPPPDQFKPPESFTKYFSPEAMVDELAARHHHLRRKAPVVPLPAEPPPLTR